MAWALKNLSSSLSSSSSSSSSARKRRSGYLSPSTLDKFIPLQSSVRKEKRVNASSFLRARREATGCERDRCKKNERVLCQQSSGVCTPQLGRRRLSSCRGGRRVGLFMTFPSIIESTSHTTKSSTLSSFSSVAFSSSSSLRASFSSLSSSCRPRSHLSVLSSSQCCSFFSPSSSLSLFLLTSLQSSLPKSCLPHSVSLSSSSSFLFSSSHTPSPPSSASPHAHQRRAYTPPSKRTWSKQHSRIFTRRPLTDSFAVHRLHPALEWWRERALQPSSFFMGYPDLQSLPLRGGSAYINEMNASTLAVVLASIVYSPSPNPMDLNNHGGLQKTPSPFHSAVSSSSSAFTPIHLPQHTEQLRKDLARRAVAVCTPQKASEIELAYIFRGCLEAGVDERSVICTLIGRIEARLNRFAFYECLVLMQSFPYLNKGGGGGGDERRGVCTPHAKFMKKVLEHATLLLQYKSDDIPVEDLCLFIHLLVKTSRDCPILPLSPSLLQFIALSLIQGKPTHELSLCNPRLLSLAMAAFSNVRDLINLPLYTPQGGSSSSFFSRLRQLQNEEDQEKEEQENRQDRRKLDRQRDEEDLQRETERRRRRGEMESRIRLFCTSPILRAYAGPDVYQPSSLLTLSFLAPIVHALQSDTHGLPKRRREKEEERNGHSAGEGKDSEDMFTPLHDRSQIKKPRQLTEASAIAAEAACAEVSDHVKSREGKTIQGIARCLERVYDYRSEVSVHHITSALYAAAVARVSPCPSFFSDLMKLVHDQLGVCTPEDLSKVLYALLKVPPRRLGDRRPLYIRELVRALQPVLPYADIHSLSLIFSSIAEASSFSSSTNSSSSSSLVANQEEEEENPMAGLAFGALQHFHANLHDALPGHLSLFVRNLHDLVRKAERREQEGEKNKKRDLLSLMIKDIMERTIELLPFFDEAQISNFLQGSIALQNSTISSLSFDEDSLGTRAMRWTEEIVDFLRHDLVHKGGERHPFLSPSTCLSMLVSISRLPREVCEKSRDLSLFLCDYLATERLTAPSLESDGSGSSSLSSSTENGLSSSSFSLSSSSSSSLTTLESGDLSELSSYDVEEEEEIEDLLSSSSLSFRSSNEEKKKQKSEEDNSHEVETEPTIPTATPTSSSTTTTTSVSFLSPKEVQRGSLANQHERKRRRRGKNREEDAILQRLSARDYIQLLGALKDLQIYHAKLLDKLTYFLAMKMYDLREEEQETVLNLLKSLRISFSPHRLPSSFF